MQNSTYLHPGLIAYNTRCPYVSSYEIKKIKDNVHSTYYYLPYAIYNTEANCANQSKNVANGRVGKTVRMCSIKSRNGFRKNPYKNIFRYYNNEHSESIA